MIMQCIKRNAAKCKLCGDVIESRWRNNFVTCSCGNLSVDGGKDYERRGYSNGRESYEDMNEYVVDIMPTYECCPGWWKMLDCELKEFYDIDPQLTKLSVKEKFGRADVFCYTETETRWDLLAMHEEILSKKSQETCELCGEYGKPRNERGWIQCRCDRCHGASRKEQTEIMRKTVAEYEAEINRVTSLLPTDIELSEREKAMLRYEAWNKGV